MKRIFSLLLLLFILGHSVFLHAEAYYHGYLNLRGKLGSSKDFELVLQIYGDGPCLVKGEAHYLTEGEITSAMPVYGLWYNETSCVMKLSEVYNSKVQGQFTFVVEEPPRDNCEQFEFIPTQGQWEYGEQVLEFNKVERYIPYDTVTQPANYLKFFDQEPEAASGIYIYDYVGAHSKRPADVRKLFLMANTVEVTWNFDITRSGKYSAMSAVKSRVVDLMQAPVDWHTFSLGNTEFKALVMEDVILIYETQPDHDPDPKLPEGFEIEGIYVKDYSMVKYEP